MSTIIMSQCWPLQGLSVTQKAVLISLADQANDDGVCWPAVGTIAARCCMSARAVRTAMDHLEAVGLLARDRRFNSSTVYSVTPAKFNAAAAPSKGTRKTGKNGTAPGAGAAPHAGGA
ncbi:helix-turn-helix domain-containing protein, partial [Klebsiella pneumoniae]